MLNEDLLKKAIELYAGKHVLNRIIELEDNAFVREGEIVLGTIYSQKIDNLSSISETLKTDSYLQFLSDYLDNSVESINNKNGTIDSISGDLIISYWKDKIFNNHAILACEAALESIENNSGTNSLNLSIGIHTSNFISGNFGSKYRLVHTIIGDALNLADKLSSINKYYGTNIIISDTVKNKLDNTFIYRELDKLFIAGNNSSIVIYELYGFANRINSNQIKMLDLFNDGLNEFKNHNWANAINIFNNIIDSFGHDGPSKNYLAKCNEFINNPPSKQWDGGFTIK